MVPICAILAGCSAGGDLKDAEAYKQRARANFLQYSQLAKETRNMPGAVGTRGGTAEYYSQGVASQKKALLDAIISDLTKALKLDPADAQAYFERGRAYERKGHFDWAIADFTSALGINPRFIRAYFYRGNTYFDKHQWEKALSDFEQTFKLNPDDYVAFFNKALVLEKMGRRQEAFEAYHLILQKAPPEYEYEIEDARRRIGKFEN